VDHVLKIDTPYGPCWRRYNHDGYGQRKDGGPFMGWGQGRAWPLLTGERAHYELAAGGDYKSLIEAVEKFSSKGGMLPEQIWDKTDIPSEGMYLGRSAGAAQPLVWAHSEYLKLLRSTADGKVVDRIAIVEERYGVAPEKRRFKNHYEIYSAGRPITEIPAGHTLRIVDSGHFRVVYSLDYWVTVREGVANLVCPSGSYVDIVTPPQQAGRIIFTLVWRGEGEPNRWLGRNVEVAIVPPAVGS